MKRKREHAISLAKLANCHPERTHHARGFCFPCYQQRYRVNGFGDIIRKSEPSVCGHPASTRNALRYCKQCLRRYKLYGVLVGQIAKFCEICGVTVNLNADHDHATGKFRGTLCSNCNMGLGSFKDDTELLQRACSYLEATG